MTKDIIRQSVVIITVLLTIAMNALVNILPLNGQTSGEVSDKFDVYFVPADYVFSIWSLIYLGLIGFASYQALPAQRTNPRLQRVGYMVAATGVVNAVWLVLWHYEQFPLTIITMLMLLTLLIAIYQSLEIGQTQVALAETWLVRVPFSLYLGWITVATVSNATVVLDYFNWQGGGISPQIWTVIMLAVASLLGIIVGLNRADATYVFVLVWAFVGIAIKQAGVPTVATAAWVAAIAMALLVGVIIFRQQIGRPTLTPAWPT